MSSNGGEALCNSIHPVVVKKNQNVSGLTYFLYIDLYEKIILFTLHTFIQIKYSNSYLFPLCDSFDRIRSVLSIYN